jgi:hypothetical protein
MYTDAEVNAIVTVLEGSTDAFTNVAVAQSTTALGVLTSTNRVYLASTQSVKIIDDATLTVRSLPVANPPGGGIVWQDIAIDQARGRVFAIHDSDFPYVTVVQDSTGSSCTPTLTPASQSFRAAGGGGTLSVSASSTCSWIASSNASWITLTGGTTGTGSGTVQYTAAANTTSAPRSGTIAVSGATFTVKQDTVVTATPSSIVFGATRPAGSTTFLYLTSPQTVSVGYDGVSASTSWTAAADQPWVQITNGSGTGPGRFTVSILNPNNVLGASTDVTATVTLTVSTMGIAVPVAVRLIIQTTSAQPVGAFDTPAPGTVQGSIAVTGWALDDIEVVRVEIWRDLTSGETTPPFNGPGHPGHGKVFIANALFVPGARPDVEAAFPNSPFASRAGWGYLLLTWGLWNQGNGNFTLYAFAFDKEGKAATLGSKAITSANQSATRPFGSIDTPTYGETVTTNFWNFGWALTPNPNSADMRSCTITNGNVSFAIDSGPLTAVTYGGARSDIAGAFPGFSNGSNAGGAYFVDLAPLVNGTHSIGWYVVDNCGRSEGVGSRFFTVAKSSLTIDASSAWDAKDTKNTKDQISVVRVRRMNSDWDDVPLSPSGTYLVTMEQSERIEVQLPVADETTYAGAQVINGERRPLPVGSSLNKENGTFYWQPAAGFLGAFDLEFVAGVGRTGGPHKVRPTRIRIVVGPPLRMAIDTPHDGLPVDQSFTIAGWALDLAAIDGGSGIDTVHLWTYPMGGKKPIFLGVAAIGDARPDVAATYGAQFEHSSFSLSATSLAPGEYDVVVYPHRSATNDFQGGQVVRVTVH